MQLTELTGDIFTSTLSKCHAVSADQRQGAGIALQFRQRYGRIGELLQQKKGVGEVAYFKLKEDEFIFTLVTKSRFWDKPTYDDLYRCLRELAHICKEQGVCKLAMPRIGCGLDRLSWCIVKKIILDVWDDTPMQIFVYTL